NNPPKDFAFDLYVLLRGLNKGYTIKEIEVLFPPRVHGESNWSSTFSSKFKTIKKMVAYMFLYKRENM
ncbi:MAG: hypothetical protein KDD50_06300, partial [Bdellovibrionales bacterium]|nr:hypothetical protein [Bdellovibrionales bacterium]